MYDGSIIIASHQMLYGASQALRDYFLKRNQKKVIFIGLPLVENKEYSLEIYKNGIKRKNVILKFPQIPQSIRYFLDFIIVFYWCLKNGKNDIFIGVDPLNAITGLVLRFFGKVNYVIFYSIDFVPERFSNNLLNYIYHKIEEYCVKKSNESWNVSPRISEGREKFLKISPAKYKQKVVPIGIWKNEISKSKLNKKNRHQIFFVGHLLEKQGVQEVIKAIDIIRKRMPNVKFVIAGGGDYENELRKLVKDFDLETNVQFLGWINKRKKLRKIMEESALAVACYKPERARLYNFTYYADPTKLKDYLCASLPVILTDVPYNAKDIEENKCGIIVEYKKEAIAKGILAFLMDEKKLINFRNNANKYILKYEWKNIFDSALHEVIT